MPAKSKTAAEPRVRTFHYKSRLGCKTCKYVWSSGSATRFCRSYKVWSIVHELTQYHRQRRVKCDEERPICGRCRKSGRECVQEPDVKPLVRSKNLTFTILMPAPKSPVQVDEPSAIAIDYFLNKSVPVLRQCRESPLWNHVLQLLHQGGPVVRHIASALGQHQRCIDNKLSPDADEKANVFYESSLRALRKSIAAETEHPKSVEAMSAAPMKSTGVATVPGRTNDDNLLAIAGFMLVVLESLRGSPANVLIHLQYCIQMFRNPAQGEDAAAIMRELAHLIECYSVTAMTAHPYSPSAALARRLLKELWTYYHPPNDFELVDQSLTIDLINEFDELSVSNRRQSSPRPDPDPRIIAQKLQTWQLKEAALQDAIDERVATCSTDTRLIAQLHFIQARAQLAIFSLRQIVGGSNETDQLAAFQRIVDLEEAALAHFRLPESYIHADIPNCFSVGLAAISVLSYVAIRCKDFYIRRKALILLESCPRKEGVWDVDDAMHLCKAVIKYEETKAADSPLRKSPTHIPEDCQVHHAVIMQEEGRKFLRLFYKASPKVMDLAFEDVAIPG